MERCDSCISVIINRRDAIWQKLSVTESDEFGNGHPAHILEHKPPYEVTLARNLLLVNWSHHHSLLTCSQHKWLLVQIIVILPAFTIIIAHTW